MLGIGGFTPLEGFMTHADWQGVCDGMRMASGLFWPIPITLSGDPASVESMPTGADVALVDPDDGSVLATMKVTEKYAIDKAHECATVFRTTDLEHPGVKMVMAAGRREPRRPGQGAVDRRLPGEVRRAVHDAGRRRARCSRRSAGRRSPRSRPATRCTARTNTWPRWRSRSATACWCTRCSARSSRATFRPTCAPRRSPCWSSSYFAGQDHRAGRLPAGHALRRSARGAAARAVPAELRLLAPDRRARPRRRRQLLRPVRCAPHLRPDSRRTRWRRRR